MVATNAELFALALQQHQAGHLQAAEPLYRQILQSDPQHADALHLLGVMAHQVGDHAGSVEYISRAIEINGDSPVAYSNLAIALHDLRRIPEAIAAYRRVLERNPQDAKTYSNLGVALKSQGLLEEAMACYRTAIQWKPDCVEAHNNLGIELKDQGQTAAAIDCYRRALDWKPDYVEVHNNLGNALKDHDALDDAVASFRRALQLRPDYSEAHNNLGNALKDQGKLDEALACYRRAIELNPQFVNAHSNLIYTRVFCPSPTDHEPWADHQQWNLHHAAPLAPCIEPHLPDRSTDRRLRIGYVSPDFRDHCQSFFMTPLLSSHDREAFEIVCYADVARPDQITDRLRAHVDIWRNIVGQSDEQVAQQIRQDQIDILVDLTMHMAHNRLRVFARKPAPIQACWLAYPGTTGLPTMDYRLTDLHLDPPGLNDQNYSEESMRLPDSFWCYDPLDDESSVTPLPAAEQGVMTFGCLNNFCKVNATTLQLWAQVLNAVVDSRLVILTGEGSHRQQTRDMLRQAGVDSDRVTFVPHRPRAQYLNYYHDIDIGLDTVPYNGHTTSLDSFWMGVPVVTLVGETVVGRAGLCQLTNLGLPELIAETPAEFVRITTELAHDLARLSELRATLRSRMQASPLMDAPRFARHIEAAYREMWQRGPTTPRQLPGQP